MTRNISLDVLKLSMAFMVVGLHTAFLGDVSDLLRYLSVSGLFRIAVPTFTVISGFYFYQALSAGNAVVWLKRIFLMYVFWMLFYSYYWFKLPDLSFASVRGVVMQFSIGFFHLWYLSGILGAALLVMLTRRWNTAAVVALIAATFIGGVLLQYLGNYQYFDSARANGFLNAHWPHRNFLLFSYPFFAIGFLINKYSLQKRVSQNVSFVLMVAGVLLLFGESYYNFNNPANYGGFDNFASLLIAAPFLFVFFLNLEISGTSKTIALYASSIYFIHILVRQLLVEFTGLNYTPLTLVTIALSALLSIGVIAINKRVKFML